MSIKNYTSATPAWKSINNIEKYLVAAGATDISKKYENGICTAITFRMVIRPDYHTLFFQLPAKVEACFDVFWKEIKQPKKDTKLRIREQAERTAWKIVCDWVQVQLSMIQLDQAEIVEVFLPYVYDPRTDQTFYHKIKDNAYKQLIAP